MTNRIYGPLIVLPPGEEFDPSSDIPFVFSLGAFGPLGEMALINGTPQSKTMQLRAGRSTGFDLSTFQPTTRACRCRFVTPTVWPIGKLPAKDGADLPPESIRTGKAELTITVGETYDVEFSSGVKQDFVLDLLLPGQKIHTSQTLSFVATASQSSDP